MNYSIGMLGPPRLPKMSNESDCFIVLRFVALAVFAAGAVFGAFAPPAPELEPLGLLPPFGVLRLEPFLTSLAGLVVGVPVFEPPVVPELLVLPVLGLGAEPVLETFGSGTVSDILKVCRNWSIDPLKILTSTCPEMPCYKTPFSVN